jgi:hypothetical protein
MVAGLLSERNYLGALLFLVWLILSFLRHAYAEPAPGPLDYYLREKPDLAAWGEQLWRVCQLAIEVGIVWAVPAIVLGVLLSFLKRPSQFLWLWSPLALGGALITLVFVIAQGQPWLLLPTVLLLAASLLFWKSERVEDLGPLLAASVTTVAFPVAAIALHLSPLAMYSNIHAVVIPPGVGETEWEYLRPQLRPIDKERNAGKRIEMYTNVLKWIDEFDPNRHMRELPQGLWSFVFLDKDAMREHVEERKALEEAVRGKKRQGNHQGEQRSHAQEEEERMIRRDDCFGLATIGSLSFWVALGLLAAWHLQRRKEAAKSNSTEHRSP